MSEPVQLAKSARELLAAALNALQTNRAVPPEIEALAEPIAQAMNIMHRIERSGGQSLEGRDVALSHVREALNNLQRLTVADPLVDVLMEHIATSLSKVHALTRVSAPAAVAPAPVHAPPTAPREAPAVAPAPAPAYAAPAAPVYAAPAPAAPVYAAPAPAAPVYAAPVAAAPAPAAPAYAAPAPAAPAYAVPAPAAPAYAAAVPAAPVRAAPPPAAPAYAAPPAAAPAHAPAAPPAPPSQPQAAAPPTGSSRGAAPGTSIVDVELGAFTASNFYKGLGGSDVIEHGGIFVATYKIPKIGSPVNLRVRLPGNYEFYASALVQWTREPGGSGDSAEPGFGARFTQIAPDGRQLVYRYTRNREPIFYDDL